MKVFKINENTVKLLSCEEIATYAVISNAKTKDNSCYCYEKYIADKLNITDRTVRKPCQNTIRIQSFYCYF